MAVAGSAIMRGGLLPAPCCLPTCHVFIFQCHGPFDAVHFGLHGSKGRLRVRKGLCPLLQLPSSVGQLSLCLVGD